MRTIVKADEKGRIPIRGTKRGRRYLVIKEGRGWWVTRVPARGAPQQRWIWSSPQKDLSEHLQSLADLGFGFEPSQAAKEKVAACRF